MREWGGDDGTAFLFWHSLGLGASGETVAVAAPPLVDAGYRVVAPDAPGYGRSEAVAADGYALDALASLLWEVADALGIDRAVVSGHSWGGAVGVAAAGARPDRTLALVLYDSGMCDYADWPGADLTATREQLIAEAREGSEVESWDALLEMLRAERLDQPWTLAAWREATLVQDDGRIIPRVDPVARGAAVYELTHGRPSDSWPAVAAAGIPTLLVLASEPDEVRETNERLLPRFLEAVPQAKVVRPGCRHQVFADLGEQAGELVEEWLRAQGRA